MAKVMNAGNDFAHAVNMAAKGGKAINDLIADLATKAGEVAAGPVTVLNTIRKQYAGKEDQILVDFPRLDTTFDPENPTNEHCENYKVQEEVEGQDTKTRPHNFFTDYISATDFGKSRLFVQSQCKLALGKTPEKAERLYQDMSRHALENLKTKVGNELTKARKWVRQAIGCWEVMQALGEHLIPKTEDPLVVLEHSEAATKNSVPFNLVDGTRHGYYRPMTVGDVMKLDVDAAVKKGGHLYDTLKSQLARDIGDGAAGKAGKKYPVPTSVDQAYDAIMSIVNYLDNESDTGRDHQGEIKARMAQKKGGELMIRAVARWRMEANALWTPALQTRHERMIEAEIAAGGADENPADKAAAA